MAQPPFPNEYLSRLVGDSDSKACTVCYKPTTTVLLASNKADFFYICPFHLKDDSFGTPIHPESYTKLLLERQALEKKMEAADRKAELNKPYSWNKIMNTIGWSKDDKKDDKDDNKDDKKDEKKSIDSYKALVAEATVLKNELSTLNETIANFKFKNYKLNKDIYRMRVNGLLQAKAKARRQQEMQNPSFFPSAPSNNIQ